MKITKCRLCGSDKLSEIISLGFQYLSDFRNDNVKPPKYPLDLTFCNNCYFVQLEETAPLSELYTPRYGFKSGINNSIKADLKSIVAEGLKIKSDNKNKIKPIVMDIGANDGTLLSNYSKEYYRIGVEPIKKFAEECKLHADFVVNDFFSFKSVKKALKNRKADIITSVSMFYDIENPDDFVRDIKICLADDGVWIIQQNYLLLMLTHNAFDNICHEHVGYYSLVTMEYLLNKHDLEIVDVSTSLVNAGVFRTIVKHRGQRCVSQRVIDQRLKEFEYGLYSVKPYKDFELRIKRNNEKMKKLINSIIAKGQKIYMYGASTRGATIWQSIGINNQIVPFAVERNPKKVGSRIASMDIPIISESQARLDKPEYMLVSIYFFAEEIIKREKEYLANGGHLIFPLPELRVV